MTKRCKMLPKHHFFNLHPYLPSFYEQNRFESNAESNAFGCLTILYFPYAISLFETQLSAED